MTVSEAKLMYVTSKCAVSANTNIVQLCWQIYQSLDYTLVKALMLVNTRVDWTKIAPGAEIEYFSVDVMNQLV